MLSRPRVHSPARVLAVVTSTLCLTLLTSCSTENAGEDTATDPAGSAAESPPEEVSPSAEASTEAAGSCDYPSDGTPPAKAVEPPPAAPTSTDTVAVEIITSAGTINAELDGATTPCTVNSFLSLAEQNYFNDTECHRLTTEGIFVLQCGDPTATGTGGPGYTIPDELTGDETYPAGTLAMAKTPAPNSGGSQFFVVYEDTELLPDYTVFGTIDEAGLQVVQEIADEGTQDGAPDGLPKTAVTIQAVTAG